MKKKDEVLTSEKLKLKFANQFEMVNTAIKQARLIVHSDRSSISLTENENIAFQVIQELVKE